MRKKAMGIVERNTSVIILGTFIEYLPLELVWSKYHCA